MERKVTYAKLQTEYFCTGTGNLGTSLGDPNKHRGMEMSWTNDGLLVKYKGVEFLIPPGNVAGATLAPKSST